VARVELRNEPWLRKVAKLAGRSFEEMRVIVLEFLDTDIFHLSAEHCVSSLDPLLASWDIDLATFRFEIVLNHQVAAEHVRRFEFVERGPDEPLEEPGLREFLDDPSLSGRQHLVPATEPVPFGHGVTPVGMGRDVSGLRPPGKKFPARPTSRKRWGPLSSRAGSGGALQGAPPPSPAFSPAFRPGKPVRATR
jgi:hypothetical protein